ncbi:hypothetical protein MHYP_G00105650 [Metynnis hypsauchen]
MNPCKPNHTELHHHNTFHTAQDLLGCKVWLYDLTGSLEIMLHSPWLYMEKKHGSDCREQPYRSSQPRAEDNEKPSPITAAGNSSSQRLRGKQGYRLLLFQEC